jgi:hypothetical protein
MRRGVVVTLLVAALGAAVAAPLLAAAGSAVSFPLYAAFSWICHQRPERSWLLAGYPVAVCVRCLGLYAGALAGAAAGWRFSRRWGLAGASVLAAQWGLEASGWIAPIAGLRFAAGFAAAFVLVPGILREPKVAAARNREVRREVHA